MSGIVKLFSLFYFLYFKLINAFNIGKNYRIKGFIYIRNKGVINIGDNFKANAGRFFNPIGGDTNFNMICLKNAKLKIGSNVNISNSSFFVGNSIQIGNKVFIGGGCKFWDTDFHSLDPKIRNSDNDNDIKTRPILIKDNVFIGGGSIILKGVTIGENSIVAAGSVVTKSIPNNEIWGGAPAKFIRSVTNKN